MKSLLILLFCCSLQLTAQNYSKQNAISIYDSTKRLVKIDGILYGDSIPTINLPEIDVVFMQKMMKRHPRRYSRLTYNVLRVYPYAKGAAKKLNEYDSILTKIPSEKEKRLLMKQAEDDIYTQYGKELKKLTFTQGKILLKLIDRETGNTSYNLVQELRGKIRAFFWQGFAKIWGYNLKVHYDPIQNDEDKMIENIVLLIETGML